MKPVVFPRFEGNAHLCSIVEYFGNVSVSPDALPAYRRLLFVCFTNRCGSGYLAHALHSTGRLNLAREFLNQRNVLADARQDGHARFAAFLGSKFAAGMVDGIFAFKAAARHLEILGRAGVLEQCLGSSHFVHIERSDRLAQAISFAIGLQTRQWNSSMTAATPVGELMFSRLQITEAMERFAEDNRQFDRFFGCNGIVPTHVTYEALVADPAPAVRSIGAAIGLPGLEVHPATIAIGRQAGPVNARWRELYLAGE